MSETLDDLLKRVEKKEPVIEQTEEKTAEQLAAEAQAAAEQENEKEVIEPELDEHGNPIEVQQPKSFSDVLKAVTTETPAEEKKVEIPQEFLTELESYKAKLSEYESDPLVKAVTQGATKEQLVAIAAELNGKDYSKSSYQDLLAMKIQELGFEGEALIEQLEEAMSEFASMPKYKQIQAEKSIQAEFEAKAVKGESPTLKAIEEAYAERMKGVETPEQIKQKMAEIEKAEKAAIKRVTTQLVGAVHHGVELTAEMLTEIESEYNVERDAIFVNDKGEFNVAEFIETKFAKKNLAKVFEAGRLAGIKEANKGAAHVKGQVKQTNVTTNKLDPKQQELKDIGLGNVVEAPKSIQWRE